MGEPENPDGNCTIYSPGTGKNVLTVGASSSGEARRPLTGEDGESRIDENGTYLDSVPGDIDTVAFFSSYGPMRDGRIKPEVLAPGDQVRFAGIVMRIWDTGFVVCWRMI